MVKPMHKCVSWTFCFVNKHVELRKSYMLLPAIRLIDVYLCNFAHDARREEKKTFYGSYFAVVAAPAGRQPQASVDTWLSSDI